ncbi:MAG TPA: tryptophan synthase subunit alpha [bacterium]|nr:tryptophan synthase subunit alpha [bacterium]
MSRIGKHFDQLKKEGRVGLVPFITAGDPNLPRTLELLEALAEAGADVIELGMPFSDPMADGPTIQAASERALKNYFGLPELFELVENFRKRHDTPLLLFGYYNPVFSFGEEKFVSEAQESGVDGILIVDLPPEEGEGLRGLARKAGLDVIYLTAPTTPDGRMAEIAAVASGFIYYVCVTGVTGERASVSTTIPRDVARIRKYSALPVAVGFGISTPEQAAAVAREADAVVVGSAIVRIVGEYGDSDEMVGKVREFVSALRRGIDER